MQKILKKNSNDDEIWKLVWEYFHDKDVLVKSKAIETLTIIFHKKNFPSLYHLLENEEETNFVLKNLRNYLETYGEMIKVDSSSKMQIVSFCNRIFRSRDIENTTLLFSTLKDALIPVLGEEFVAE